MIENVEEEEIFCRERTPPEMRVFGALTSHAGASYRTAAALLGISHEALRQWYLRLAHLFEPRRQARPVVAVDVRSVEIVHVDVTPGRSSLDAVLFLKTVLERCRGTPIVIVDPGPWDDWPLETLGCRFRKETWGTRSCIESLFFVVKYRLWRFWKRFPSRSSGDSTRRWCRAFAAIHNLEALS